MPNDPEESSSRLIAEQLEHTLDLIRAELSATQHEQQHNNEINQLRLKTLEACVSSPKVPLSSGCWSAWRWAADCSR